MNNKTNISLTNISILVPMYNVEKTLERCLQSVVDQTYQGDIECIIVDDCSPDNSYNIAYEFISKYKGNIHFKIVRHDVNKGLSAVRNTGIRNAKGEYIIHLDSDDRFLPCCIEELTKYAERYNKPDIVVGKHVLTFASYLYGNFEILPDYVDNKAEIAKLFSDYPVTIWNKLIKRSFIIENDLWLGEEKEIIDDILWNAISMNKISSIACTKTITYEQYRSEGSITNVKYQDSRIFANIVTTDYFFSNYSEKEYRPQYIHFFDRLSESKLVVNHKINSKLYVYCIFIPFIIKHLFRHSFKFSLALLVLFLPHALFCSFGKKTVNFIYH